MCVCVVCEHFSTQAISVSAENEKEKPKSLTNILSFTLSLVCHEFLCQRGREREKIITFVYSPDADVEIEGQADYYLSCMQTPNCVLQ